MERDPDDQTLAGLPWASVFDPAANVRALGEIQRRGLRAAGEVVDRLVRSVDGDGGPPPVFGAEAGVPGTDLEQLATAWWTVLAQMLDVVSPNGGPAAAPHPTLDLGAGVAAGAVELAVDAPGSGTAEVWLVNMADSDAVDVALAGTDLVNHDGSTISRDHLSVEPGELAAVPARSTRGVAVTVDVAAGTAPGVYRGTLLARGRPELWLNVSLAVGPGAAG